MLSKELTLKCFPHKEAVIYNIELCLQLHGKIHEEQDRVDGLCEVHRYLREENYKLAIDRSRRAGYNLMAQAIALHWLGDINAS